MSVIKMNPEDLRTYQQNNRKHSSTQVERIARSIEEFGFNQPIVVDENKEILVGHGRLLAAQRLGLADVPVKEVTWLTEEQKRAYRILDNKLQNDSEWDFDNLGLELGWLDSEGFDLGSWGLDELLPPEEREVEEDGGPGETPEEEDVFIKRGDLIELGRHRVYCGDCTEEEEVVTLMDGEEAGLFCTDPPYGVAYVENAKSKGQAKDYGEIENDQLDGVALQRFLEECIRAGLPHLKEGTPFYLWHPMLTQGTFFAAAAAADILINRQIIWVKPNFIFGRGDYHWRHELCFYGWIRGSRPVFYGERNQDTIWEIGRENDKIHPTQKPVELFKRPITNHLKPGEIAYEPFLGSGSQLIAADQLNRTCYGMEIEPKYCHVIMERYKNYCVENGKKTEIKINGEKL